MIYKEFPIHPKLAPYVQLVWMMESESDQDTVPMEQIMPDGILEFVTHYADPWVTITAGGQAEVQPESFVISQMRKYIEIGPERATGMISVRFYPWGGYHFFDKPVDSFLDGMISSKDLWPLHCNDFIQNVRNAPSHEARAAFIQEFLLDRLAEYRKNSNGLDEAIKLLRKSGGQLSIEDVCRRTGFSKKQLERKFIPAVGTTPKIFARVSRFLNICHHLEEHRDKSLTQLAHECGYFDQSHFIKEFREFSGYTPKAFFARKNVGFADL